MNQNPNQNQKHENYQWERFKYKVKKFLTNPDIALGFFLGSSFTSVVWLIIQIYAER